jgi:hypothetical protein
MFVPGPPVNQDTKHTTGELVCKQVDLATWQTLTTKGSISTRPTLYAAFRMGATVMLRFWPVPSEDGTMRLKTVRLLGSNADGTKNVDLHRYWFDALVWCLAFYVAVDSSMPSDKISFLNGMAEDKKAKCVNYAFEHTGATARVVHPSLDWGYR